MTKLQKIKEIVWGLVMLVSAIIVMINPDDGYSLIITLLSVWLILYGASTLLFYFQMARFMVDGRTRLYMGIIMLDFGILTFSLTDVPHYYILLYLILIHAFSGLIEILRVYEIRRTGGRSFKLKLVHGITNIVIACVCIVFMTHIKAAVFVYSVGLIYSALMRIISACRKKKFIYIQ